MVPALPWETGADREGLLAARVRLLLGVSLASSPAQAHPMECRNASLHPEGVCAAASCRDLTGSVRP